MAAGAVAFVLRLSGALLVERRLGIAFRAIALPAATAVAALTVAAAHDGLEHNMQSVLAVASLMSVAVSAPFGLLQRSTRAAALVLLLAVASGNSIRGPLTRPFVRARRRPSSGYAFARGVATFAWIVELGTFVFTLLWLGGARRTRLAALAAATLLFGFVLALVAREGMESGRPAHGRSSSLARTMSSRDRLRP